MSVLCGHRNLTHTGATQLRVRLQQQTDRCKSGFRDYSDLKGGTEGVRSKINHSVVATHLVQILHHRNLVKIAASQAARTEVSEGDQGAARAPVEMGVCMLPPLLGNGATDVTPCSPRHRTLTLP